MKKSMKRFRIEQLGDFSTYSQSKILECFMEADDRILFHRFDTKLSEIKPKVLERLKNETFDDFCDGLIYFYPSNGNKEVLISNIINILSLCKMKYECEDSPTDLYLKLLAKDELVLSWEEIQEIKAIIFDMVTFKNINIEEDNWRKARTVFENKFYLEERGIRRGNTTSIWYCPKNEEELIQTMEREVDYSCIVLNKNQEFSEYIKRDDFRDLSLTIYYLSPFIFTAAPISETDLAEGMYEYKVTVNGRVLQENKDLIEQIMDADLIPVEKETYINARLYYVFETKKGDKLYSVSMWGDDNSMFVNGFEVEENETLYDMVIPFLPEKAVQQLQKYINEGIRL